MENTKFPEGSVIKTSYTEDGDELIDSVTYPTMNGGKATVKFERSLDGDMIPQTGFTLDGDYNFPNRKYSID